MTEKEFDLLMSVRRNEDISLFPYDVMLNCQKSGWIKDKKITNDGLDALAPYKVDNAVIMAAGRSRRCMPLSNYLPKGLFEIKGETMVERQIKQLKDAGVKQIVLVAGYLKEKYHELAKKYPDIIVIDNDEWNDKNNLFSLWYAKDYLKNSYVCCSDNWFAHNVFRDHVYDSYYACKYSDSFIDEYCVKSTDENGYATSIKKGGEKAWYTIGEAFFTKDFSKKFVELLANELYDPQVKYELWDDFQIRHMTELKLKIKGYPDSECMEFDTTEDILAFSPNFKDFIEQFMAEEEIVNSKTRISYLSDYAEIKQYSVIATEQSEGRLHVNENLFGPSPKCMDVLKNATIEDVSYYDLTREDCLAAEVSKMTNLPADNIFIHSGSSDVIKTIMTIVLNKDDTVLISTPAWNYYKSVVELRKAKAAYYGMIEGKDRYEFDVKGILEKAKETNPKIITITTPHNPTGAVMNNHDLEKIIKDNPKSLIIVDEAYLGFSDVEFDVNSLITSYSNVVFSRTFSKLYGLAGMRVGYGICNAMAKQVFKLDLNPFRINNLSRKMAVEALRDTKYYDDLRTKLSESRDWFTGEVAKIQGVKSFYSCANFVFMHFVGYDVQKIKEYMGKNGILVRMWSENGHLSMRITVAKKPEMEKALKLLKEGCKQYKL
jgi:histidinol-phosphate aminotransferase